MTTLTVSYSARSALTWTPEGVATSTYDFSAVVDNTSNKYVDVLVSGKVTPGTSPTSARTVTIFAYGEDGNGQYTGGVSGSDGGTPGTGEQAQCPVVITIPTDNTSDHTYEWGPISLARLFGGVMPPKWGLGLYNDTGVALNATAANQVASYQGITYTVA
jgi:hypothetical protein